MKRILAAILTLMMIMTTVPAMAELSQHVNEQLYIWCQIFKLFQENTKADNPDGDYCEFNGGIAYDENSMRSNGAGIRMIDGGKTSDQGSFSVGVGASPDDENMWYVSFTYNSSTDIDTIIANTFDMLLTTSTMFEGFGETEEEISENLLTFVQYLIATPEDVAIEVGDVVLATKFVGNQMIIMVDTLDFYNAFYKGSIENYLVF